MVLLGHDGCSEEQLASCLQLKVTWEKDLTPKIIVRVVVGTTKNWHALCFCLASSGK